VRRRELIAALGSAAAWPLVARAQQQPALAMLSKRPLIGFLGTSAKAVGGRYFDGFAEGMNQF